MLGEICMNAFQVTCPGCGTILKLPAGFSAGKIKCPKCAKVLALQNPSPSPAPQQPVSQASPQANQSDGASPFDSLPAFGSPSSGQPGIGLPASQPPAQLPSHAAAFHQPKAGNSRNAAKPKQRKPSKGSPLKIVLIVGGIIGGLGILGCAGLIGLAVIGARSQTGWQTISQQGVTVQIPAGRIQKSSKSNSASTATSFRVSRGQTGSVFGLQIIELRSPPPASLNAMELMEQGGTVFSNTRSVTRDGKLGYHATVVSSTFTGVPAGTEVEIFRRGSTLIIMDYIAYSKQTAGATDARPPRENERELDKPDDFFRSLKLS